MDAARFVAFVLGIWNVVVDAVAVVRCGAEKEELHLVADLGDFRDAIANVQVVEERLISHRYLEIAELRMIATSLPS